MKTDIKKAFKEETDKKIYLALVAIILLKINSYDRYVKSVVKKELEDVAEELEDNQLQYTSKDIKTLAKDLGINYDAFYVEQIRGEKILKTKANKLVKYFKDIIFKIGIPTSYRNDPEHEDDIVAIKK